MQSSFSLAFPFAHGGPVCEAGFRQRAEDFQVDEVLDFPLSGSGEHLLVRIKKTGQNTGFVASLLAERAGVRQMDVGFCGLKDRHAVTTQWFSLYLPKTDTPDLNDLGQGIDVLEITRHHKKLRRGDHQCNQFVITLRDLTPATEQSLQAITQRLQSIAVQGVPNYFGEQRFGRDGGNLQLADNWFVNNEPVRRRNLRSLVISAGRSYLFNQMLGARVKANHWCTLIDGELGVEPCLPLWGRGRSKSGGALAELEHSVLQHYEKWCDSLEHLGLKQERRATVLKPQDFSWRFCRDSGSLSLQFSLQAGQFATAVLRELAVLHNAQK